MIDGIECFFLVDKTTSITMTIVNIHGQIACSFKHKQRS